MALERWHPELTFHVPAHTCIPMYPHAHVTPKSTDNSARRTSPSLFHRWDKRVLLSYFFQSPYFISGRHQIKIHTHGSPYSLFPSSSPPLQCPTACLLDDRQSFYLLGLCPNPPLWGICWRVRATFAFDALLLDALLERYGRFVRTCWWLAEVASFCPWKW